MIPSCHGPLPFHCPARPPPAFGQRKLPPCLGAQAHAFEMLSKATHLIIQALKSKLEAFKLEIEACSPVRWGLIAEERSRSLLLEMALDNLA